MCSMCDYDVAPTPLDPIDADTVEHRILCRSRLRMAPHQVFSPCIAVLGSPHPATRRRRHDPHDVAELRWWRRRR
jgi:hypothetical protein